MQMNVRWSRLGRYRRIRFTVCGWLHQIFSSKPAGRSRSYLGGDLRQNSAAFLVRDDLPRLTSSVRTVAARQPESTSP